MAQVKEGSNPEVNSVIKRLDTLEKRIVKLESLLRLEWTGDQESLESIHQQLDSQDSNQSESQIVEYGLAWIGSIVLLLGIIFLTSYMSGLGYQISSVLFGYITALIIIGATQKWGQSLPILSKVMNLCSIILFYYLTIRLYFFNDAPLISNKWVVIGLAFSVITYQFYFAIKKSSERQAILGALLLIITSIICNSTNISLGILILASTITTILIFNYGWWRLTVLGVLMVYFTHLFWLLGNPIISHDIAFVSSGQNSIFYLFGYAIIYAMSILVSREIITRDSIIVSITICNASLFSLLLLISVPALYAEFYALIFLGIAFACLLLSVYLKLYPARKFAPATYASFGFSALSVAIYGYWGLPDAYFIFALQSFLVVLIALWYRSQIIVVINVFLFVVILLAYLISSDSINSINFVLALTALATARILNWKKERLTLKTEIYRNIYLFIAISMLLFGLGKALPDNYVTIAWSVMAIVLFTLGVWLKNVKYRYLAIFSIVAAAIHIFLIDLANMEMGYRVVAFLAFSIISIGLSLYYTKRTQKSN